MEMHTAIGVLATTIGLINWIPLLIKINKTKNTEIFTYPYLFLLIFTFTLNTCYALTGHDYLTGFFSLLPIGCVSQIIFVKYNYSSRKLNSSHLV